MRVFFVFLVTCVTLGLAGCTPIPTDVAPRTAVAMLGATVQSPNENGWSMRVSRPEIVAFGRKGDNPGETMVAAVTAVYVPNIKSDHAFLKHIADQRVKNDDSTRFSLVKVTNRQVSFKGTQCLKFSGLSKDNKSPAAGPSGFQYMKNEGYICRHPIERNGALIMEMSYRSGNTNFPAALRSVATGFFNNIQFNNNGT